MFPAHGRDTNRPCQVALIMRLTCCFLCTQVYHPVLRDFRCAEPGHHLIHWWVRSIVWTTQLSFLLQQHIPRPVLCWHYRIIRIFRTVRGSESSDPRDVARDVPSSLLTVDKTAHRVFIWTSGQPMLDRSVGVWHAQDIAAIVVGYCRLARWRSTWSWQV